MFQGGEGRRLMHRKDMPTKNLRHAAKAWFSKTAEFPRLLPHF